MIISHLMITYNKKRPELALIAPVLERSETMVLTVTHRNDMRVFKKDNRKSSKFL